MIIVIVHPLLRRCCAVHCLKKFEKRSESQRFNGTDEKSALVFQTVFDNKTAKHILGLDRETVRSKFNGYSKLLNSNHPK